MGLPIKEQLEGFLFRDRVYTYAVLDGASVPDLPQKLFEMGPRHYCLYRGEMTDEIVHVAPYLVHMEIGSGFCNWLLSEYWGKHWGIFAQSPVSPSGMRRHFLSLITVNDDAGNPMLFRFYDPRVLVPYMMTCVIGELEIIFGPVNYYFAESFDTSELVRMHVSDGALVETKLSFGGDKEAGR
jgi:hypothetical protein